MPTMTKPIDQDYSRVISTKFAKTRDGKQMTCRYCSNDIMVGRDFAAVDGLGKWHSVCGVCATSRAAQVTGLVNKVEALAATLTGDALADLMTEAQAIDALATAAVQGDERSAVLVTPTLLAMLDKVRTATKLQAAATDPFAATVETLRRVTPVLTDARDIKFAQSLVSQWDAKGYLSPKQRPYAESLAAKGEQVEGERALAPLTAAILARVDGRASVRFAIPSGGHNDLDFLAVFAGRVERHVGTPDSEPLAHNLPAAQALTLAQRIMDMDDESFVAAQALYGQAMRHCGRCGAALTDLQSRTQGFGPECVKKSAL